MNSIYVRSWNRPNPRAVIILVHGLGEFCERYDWAATEFTKRGYAVIGADLPGHGKSPGRRGHVKRFEEFYESIRQQFARAHESYPNLPVILFGHSLGGLLVIRFLQSQEPPSSLQAVILSSPCLQFAFDVAPGQLRLLRAMSTIWPTMSQSTQISPKDVSRSPEIQQFYETNSLILHKVSVRLLAEFYDAMEAARTTSHVLTVPLLVTQAGEDKLVAPEASREFIEKLNAPAKEFRLYPQCHHELLNEPEREDILNGMVEWLEHHIPSGSAQQGQPIDDRNE